MQDQQWSVFLIELHCFIDEVSAVTVALHHNSHNRLPLERLARQLQVFEASCESMRLGGIANTGATLQHWLQSAAKSDQALSNPLPIVARIEHDLRSWFEQQQQRFRLAQASAGDQSQTETQPDRMVQEVFLREAKDLLAQLMSSLVQLHHLPDDDALLQGHLRALHTLKGSAGMVNALLLTHHLHDVEAQIGEMRQKRMMPAEIVSEIAVRHDFTRRLIDALSVALPLSWQCEDAPETSEALHSAGSIDTELRQKLLELTAGIPATQQILAQGVSQFQGYLSSLVREISVLSLLLQPSDAQTSVVRKSIADPASGRSVGIEKRGDQRQCMAVAQSIGSLQNLRRNLHYIASRIEQDLSTQAALVHQLQRQLILSGMVHFADVQPRLQQLVAYLARETGKLLNLKVTGGETYIEPGLLAKLIAPLEHLLRNAVVHGIESSPQRTALGKPTIGTLHLDIRQCGSELRINLSDDGQGLDLPRIRAVSIEKGWFDPQQSVSSEALAELIFHPGFSTSDELTVLAGRGVGLDVVRAELWALEGEISVQACAGVGATFYMRLPQSSVLASVLVIQCAQQTYAIDVSLIEQILPVAINDRVRLRDEGRLLWQDSTLQLHCLSTLLGIAAGEVARDMTILVLREVPVTRAIVVERVLDCCEVVVRKCHLPWRQYRGFSGMTTLAEGTVTLLVDPVQLILLASDSGLGAGGNRT